MKSTHNNLENNLICKNSHKEFLNKIRSSMDNNEETLQNYDDDELMNLLEEKFDELFGSDEDEDEEDDSVK